MSALSEANETLRERARRALMDNPEPSSSPGPEAAGYAEMVDLRLRAIRLVRDLEPKRLCFMERVGDLTRNLSSIPGDSIHYKTVLEKLREAHEEWLLLEERLRQATYIIRSTQWLVNLLADPGVSTPAAAEAAAARSHE